MYEVSPPTESRSDNDASRLGTIGTTDLMKRAATHRDELFGTRVTYSPKVFIPLTKLCRDRCGYCTFAQPPAKVEAPYLSAEQVLDIARRGASVGCREALFTLGERPELRYAAAAEWLEQNGFASTVDYLAAMCRLVTTETGLLAHANAGALDAAELLRLREVSASQGMMIESIAPDLECHRGSPDKTPERRLATLDAAGAAQIPFTTGLLVGIGDTEPDRIAALEAIRDSHHRWGHVQEVIVQNFLPKAATGMRLSEPCPPDDFLRTIALARLILPDDVHLQSPPNLSDDYGDLLSAGIDDWGGVSPITDDHVNPERPWPTLDALRLATEKEGHELVPRLTVYPTLAADPQRWLDESMRFPVLDLSDADSLARDRDTASEAGDAETWYSGADCAPPSLLPANAHRSGRLEELLTAAVDGYELTEDDMCVLFAARGREVAAVAEAADEVRSRLVGETLTWVHNRNINYTNVCTFKCSFCGFSKGPLSLNLRGNPYLLTLDEVAGRSVEAVGMGATEVCLQGGIHPNFDGDYYIDVARAVSEAAPSLHIHGFTALEVTEGAKRLGEPLDDYLRRLMAAGLKTLPGTAAEILDDDIRAVLCPDKINSEEWLEAHRVAHSVGLRSNITIMFGAVEQPRHWARHIDRTRELQKETGGFTEFVGLPFVHMAAPIYLQKRSRRGPTFREIILMHAVARLAYQGYVDNIQASWVKLGIAGTIQVLGAGVNDLGGTLIDENISRAAGASHGQSISNEELALISEAVGRPLEQRTTLYGRVSATA